MFNIVPEVKLYSCKKALIKENRFPCLKERLERVQSNLPLLVQKGVRNKVKGPLLTGEHCHAYSEKKQLNHFFAHLVLDFNETHKLFLFNCLIGRKDNNAWRFENDAIVDATKKMYALDNESMGHPTEQLGNTYLTNTGIRKIAYPHDWLLKHNSAKIPFSSALLSHIAALQPQKLIKSLDSFCAFHQVSLEDSLKQNLLINLKKIQALLSVDILPSLKERDSFALGRGGCQLEKI